MPYADHAERQACKKRYRENLKSQGTSEYRRRQDDPEKKENDRLRKRQWYQETIEYQRAYRKVWKLKKKFGLTPDQLQQLMAIQGNKCCVCGRNFGSDRTNRPNVDHCHTTGIVRGILCHGCNVAEGFLKTPETVLKLYKYLLKNELFSQSEN